MSKYVVAAIITVALAVIAAGLYEPKGPPDHGLAALVEWQPSLSDYFECLVTSFSENRSECGLDSDFYFEPGTGERVIFSMNDGDGRKWTVRYGERALVVQRPFRNTIITLDCPD